jgi:hypothetical protein
MEKILNVILQYVFEKFSINKLNKSEIKQYLLSIWMWKIKKYINLSFACKLFAKKLSNNMVKTRNKMFFS